MAAAAQLAKAIQADQGAPGRAGETQSQVDGGQSCRSTVLERFTQELQVVARVQLDALRETAVQVLTHIPR